MVARMLAVISTKRARTSRRPYFKQMTANKIYVLALDIGTSSVRAGIYDERAELLPATIVKNERTIRQTDDGGAEINADEALAQVFEAIEDVLRTIPKEIGAIEYVAASCFWHSLLGINDEGNATTPVYTWAETRPRGFVKILQAKLDERKIHNRTGARFHSSYWTAKLLWLRKDFPDVFRKTRRWISFSDYVWLKLFGKTATSVSMASGTGIFDVRHNVWDKELLEFLKIKKANLPEIVADDAETFQLNEERATKWAKLKDAQWFPAVGDGAANNLGADCVTKHKAALMIGTSGAMRVAFAGKVPKKIPNGLWCYRIDREKIICGGALSDGGGLYRWLKDNLRLKKDDDQTEAEIEKRPPVAHGLTFLPFLAGERSTGYHETAHGAILGLKAATDTIDITQAALEAVAYRFAAIFDQLNKIGEIKEIIASGGALRESPVWTQIIADVLGKNLTLPDIREASSRGVVLLALEKIGAVAKTKDLPMPKGRRFKFNRKNHEIYRTARKRHEKFYRLLIEKGE